MPSPLKSPGASSAVKPPQPLPIVSPVPVDEAAAGVAAVHQQPAVGLAGEQVGPAVAAPVGGEQAVNEPQPEPICG